MAIKQIMEDTLSLFSISHFLGMSGWRLWLGRVFQTFRSSTCCGLFIAVLCNVVSGHPAFSLLCNHQFVGNARLKLWIGRFFQTSRSLLSTRYPHICVLTSACSTHWGRVLFKSQVPGL